MSQSKKRVRVMPAIREESGLKASRIPVHIIPPGARDSKESPLQGSMIIQTLPDQPTTPPPKVTPSNRYHDNVEQVVSDYLHFARYGKVLPVSQGFAPLACPCCSDRNRENLQHRQDRSRAPPPEPDLDALPEPLSRDTPAAGPSTSHQHPSRGLSSDTPEGSSLRRGGAGGGPGGDYPDPRGFPASWMDYQPAPYAQTYLNSEFNRASLLQGYQEDRKQYDNAAMSYVSSQVVDANTKYDLAMKKLEKQLNKFSVSREDSDLSYQ